jgi:hypothetical protein|uniref:Uncharacterized protein n=1 Tax=viral metagenome TaxID=1070528 RepID=A0A6C0JCT1_9ZZZZ|tara:strand:+ start:636 stop:1022 length:387 start_codon:yes stop_codon:yes gene_type:complete
MTNIKYEISKTRRTTQANTSYEQYLYKTNKSIERNTYNFRDRVINNVYLQNTFNVNDPVNECEKIYHPNNVQFAQNGGVSSSDYIYRKVVNTMNEFNGTTPNNYSKQMPSLNIYTRNPKVVCNEISTI